MNIVINSQFKPFSYQELVLPAMQATELHSTIEQAAAELESNAEMWRSKIGDKDDEEALGLYNSFYGKLKAQTDDLAMNGLNVNSRRQLYKLKADYNREILPIETAYKKRQELVKQRAEMAIKDPSMVSDVDPSKLSISQLIENPEMTINYESGERLRQVAAQTAGSMAKSLLSDPGKLKGILPHQYQQIIQHGATPAQLLQAINEVAAGNPNSQAAKFLEEIRTNIIASSPISRWNNDELTRRGGWADSFINLGAYAMIGQADVKNHADQFSMNLDLEKIKRQWALQDEQSRNAQNIGVDLSGIEPNNEAGIYQDEMQGEIDKMIKDGILTSNTFSKDGKKVFKVAKQGELSNYIVGSYLKKLSETLSKENADELLSQMGYSSQDIADLKKMKKRFYFAAKDNMFGSPEYTLRRLRDQARSGLNSFGKNDTWFNKELLNKLVPDIPDTKYIEQALGNLGKRMALHHERRGGGKTALVDLINDVMNPDEYAQDIQHLKGFRLNFDDTSSKNMAIRFHDAIAKNDGLTLAKVNTETGRYEKGNYEQGVIQAVHNFRVLGDTVAADVTIKSPDGTVKTVKAYVEKGKDGPLNGYVESSKNAMELAGVVQKIYEDRTLTDEQREYQLYQLREVMAKQYKVPAESININKLNVYAQGIANNQFNATVNSMYSPNKK